MVSRQSNLFVESNKQVNDQQLRQMLIDEVKRQNKPYGLFFDQVTGGYTTTQRRGLQAFTVIPLVVYRVYADGRPDELIRTPHCMHLTRELALSRVGSWISSLFVYQPPRLFFSAAGSTSSHIACVSFKNCSHSARRPLSETPLRSSKVAL